MKRYLHVLLLLGGLAALGTLASCEDLDIPDDPTGSDARIAATIDGQPFTVTGILVTGELLEAGGVNTMAIGGATLPLGGTTEGFALALVHADGTAFAPGQAFTPSGTTAIAGCEYLLETGILDIRAESDNTGFGSITLTDYDAANGLASGTFEFDGVDDDDPGTVFEIRDGVFENIPLN